MSAAPFAPARHEPLDAPAWSDAAARTAAETLGAELVAARTGDTWPDHPADLEDDPPPFRSLYFGDAGVIWALARLAARGLAAPPPLAPLAAELPARWRARPDLATLYPPPQPSLLVGESGLLVLAELLAGRDDARRAALDDAIARNVENPTRELLWGAPGTMLAALELHRLDPDGPWADRFRASARALLATWEEDGLWTQDMYGREARYVGPGHGFAGNVHALLRGRALLDPVEADAIARRARDVAVRLAERHGALVQWPATVQGPPPTAVRTQWCHGAPGMVIALGAVLPPDDELDALLLGGGELTWAAGPLAGSASLCHGTAGNAYAFLRLHARTGDERWLERARAFALHAVAQLPRLAAATGAPRHPLFTGSAGVAVLLASCLDADPRFPVLDGLAP